MNLKFRCGQLLGNNLAYNIEQGCLDKATLLPQALWLMTHVWLLVGTTPRLYYEDVSKSFSVESKQYS